MMPACCYHAVQRKLGITHFVNFAGVFKWNECIQDNFEVMTILYHIKLHNLKNLMNILVISKHTFPNILSEKPYSYKGNHEKLIFIDKDIIPEMTRS